MAIYKMSSTLLSTIPNPTILGKKMTSICSITRIGSVLYILKSCGTTKDNTQYPVCLYKVENLNKLTLIKVTKDSKAIRFARHANDITYAKASSESTGYLYITTMNTAENPQLVKVTTKGVVKKEYRYFKGEAYATFNSCDYIGMENGKMKFIVGIGNINEQRAYDIAYIEGNNLVYSGITYYSQAIPNDYVSNATYYDSNTKIFYTTFFQRDSNGEIHRNVVYSYRLTNGILLTPIHEFQINRTGNYDEKFEVEGIVVLNASKYIVCNCESSKGGDYNKDGLFKIKKK